jgi:hypothetical protein
MKIQHWLTNEIEPLLHLKILDGDDDGCLVASTMIEEDHKPFTFLLQQQTSQMSKTKDQIAFIPADWVRSHDFLSLLMTFSKKSPTFFISRDFSGREKIHDFLKKTRKMGDFFHSDSDQSLHKREV